MRPCKEAKLDYAKRGNQAEEKVERGGQIIGEDRGQSIIEGALVSIGMVLFRSFGWNGFKLFQTLPNISSCMRNNRLIVYGGRRKKEENNIMNDSLNDKDSSVFHQSRNNISK